MYRPTSFHTHIQVRPLKGVCRGVIWYCRGLIARLLVPADHYTGITDNWNQGIIHCSPVTAKLVVHLLGVKPEYLKPLAMGQEHHIQGFANSLWLLSLPIAAHSS